MPLEPQAPYISTVEAAKRHHLTHDHVGLLCRKAKVQGRLLGRQWYVNEDSLVEYLKKSEEERQARKVALSKQWRTAWTAAFLGLTVFASSFNYASADLISKPRVAQARDVAKPISLTAIVTKVGEIRNQIPVPTLPTPKEVHVEQAVVNIDKDPAFLSNLITGLLVVGEGVAKTFEQARPDTLRVVYAEDFKPEESQPIEPLSMFFTAAAVNTGAVAATLVAPDVSYEAPHIEPIVTAENLLVGTMLANETLHGINTEMFALYARGLNSFVEILAFDVEAGSHVWSKTFGAFGERYVADLARLNEAQVDFYFAASELLEEQYNSLADAIEDTQVSNSAISVASTNFAPTLTMPGEKQVAAVWDGWIDFLADTFFTHKTGGTETCVT